MVNIKRSWRGVSSAVGKIRRGLNKAQPYIRGISTISGGISDIAGKFGQDKVADITGKISSYTDKVSNAIERPDELRDSIATYTGDKIADTLTSLATEGESLQSNPYARPVTAGQCNRSINGSRCDNPNDHVHLGTDHGYGPRRPTVRGFYGNIRRPGVQRNGPRKMPQFGVERPEFRVQTNEPR